MQHVSIGKYRLAAALLIATCVAMAFSGCQGGRSVAAYVVYTGGNSQRGAQVISMKKCGACHVIPGINGARGLVGPPLLYFGKTTFVAGEVPNTPDNLERWVMSPQSINPNTAMPNLGLNEQQARDVAAYLYTLQ
jgi:cytochrome c1